MAYLQERVLLVRNIDHMSKEEITAAFSPDFQASLLAVRVFPPAAEARGFAFIEFQDAQTALRAFTLRHRATIQHHGAPKRLLLAKVTGRGRHPLTLKTEPAELGDGVAKGSKVADPLAHRHVERLGDGRGSLSSVPRDPSPLPGSDSSSRPRPEPLLGRGHIGSRDPFRAMDAPPPFPEAQGGIWDPPRRAARSETPEEGAITPPGDRRAAFAPYALPRQEEYALGARLADPMDLWTEPSHPAQFYEPRDPFSRSPVGDPRDRSDGFEDVFVGRPVYEDPQPPPAWPTDLPDLRRRDPSYDPDPRDRDPYAHDVFIRRERTPPELYDEPKRRRVEDPYRSPLPPPRDYRDHPDPLYAPPAPYDRQLRDPRDADYGHQPRYPY
jgi:hypothetical protein